jgi:hypothetical protein
MGAFVSEKITFFILLVFVSDFFKNHFFLQNEKLFSKSIFLKSQTMCKVKSREEK